MIALIQDKYIRTRRGKGGKIFEYTHNFIAAGINHEVNRNDELDRHVHLFIQKKKRRHNRRRLE